MAHHGGDRNADRDEHERGLALELCLRRRACPMSSDSQYRPSPCCPACKKKGYCSDHAVDAAQHICRRGKPKKFPSIDRIEKNGVRTWMFRTDGAPIDGGRAEVPSAPDALASVQTRHETYSAMIDALGADPLVAADRQSLLARGLSEGDIKAARYFTMQGDDASRAALVARMTTALGHAPPIGVPGFYLLGSDPTVHVVGYGGQGIPVFNTLNQIVGVRVRIAIEDGGKKYVWLSRPSKEGVVGAACEASVHVPPHDDAASTVEVRITEGEYKAHIATVRTSC